MLGRPCPVGERRFEPQRRRWCREARLRLAMPIPGMHPRGGGRGAKVRPVRAHPVSPFVDILYVHPLDFRVRRDIPVKRGEIVSKGAFPAVIGQRRIFHLLSGGRAVSAIPPRGARWRRRPVTPAVLWPTSATKAEGRSPC